MLLKAVAYWLDRYELLSHTRSGKPFTGAGYTDINAVLPAKLILMAIAVICAAAVFSAIVLRDLRIPAIGVVLLLLSFADRGCRLAVGRRADQRQTQCGAEGKRVHQPKYHGDQAGLRVDGQTSSPTATTAATRRRPHSRSPPTGRRRRTSGLLDPTIVSPAFTQFQQGKNFYYFPDQLAIDRYNGPRRQPARLRGGGARTQPRPADRQPARLDQPALRLHPRQRFHRLAGQHGARGRQRSQPERRLSGVPGQRRRRQRQRGLAWARAAGSAARLLRPGHREHAGRLRDRRQERQRPRVRLRDQHRDQELHLRRHGRRADRQLAGPCRVRREVLRAKAACSPTRSAPTARSCSIATRPSGSRRWRRG